MVPVSAWRLIQVESRVVILQSIPSDYVIILMPVVSILIVSKLETLESVSTLKTKALIGVGDALSWLRVRPVRNVTFE